MTEAPLDPSDLQKAGDLCKLAGTPDLVAWLGLGRGCSPAEALEALALQRRQMQAMQANPKYARIARAVVTSYKSLERVLGRPAAYLAAVDQQAEMARLPLLALAIDSVLADGEVTETEEEFVHKHAQLLGITPQTVRRMILERARERGIDLTLGKAGSTAADGPAVPGAESYPWWDAAFVRLMRDVVPSAAKVVVDAYCRTGMSGSTLLPDRSLQAWIGLDRRAERLDRTLRLLGNDPRVSTVRAGPDQTGLPDESADVVLLVRALSSENRVHASLDEARRLLRPGGTLVCVDADSLGESFFFDGHLIGFNAAFHSLMARLELAESAASDRGGPALGPRLPALCDHRGFSVSRVVVHAAHMLKSRRYERFSRSLRRYPDQVAGAGGLPADCAELRAIHLEVDRLGYKIAPEAVGLCGTVLPLWVVVARRD